MAQQHRRCHVGGRPVSKHLAEHSQYQVRNTHTCARNLDSENSKMISDMLINYVREENSSLVLVTHDDNLASRAQRKIKIKDGKVI